jgi:hypothetical protein
MVFSKKLMSLFHSISFSLRFDFALSIDIKPYPLIGRTWSDGLIFFGLNRSSCGNQDQRADLFEVVAD